MNLKESRWSIVNALLVVALLVVLGVQLELPTTQPAPQPVPQPVIRIGHVSYAAGDLDYTYDGVDDNVQFQLAFNALPVTGGRIIDVSAVQKNFSATVTRAIPNVVIEGAGYGSNFTNDGVTAIFAAGGNGWQFHSLSTDAGGINMGATTGWYWERVNNGSGTVYDIRTPAGSIVNGALIISSLTDSGLTSGRVPYATTGGLLTDSTNLTMVNDTLVATTANFTTVNAPTGRSATYYIAAINATDTERAQADYRLAAGESLHVQYNAITALLTAGNGGHIKLSSGTFPLTWFLDPGNKIWTQGSGTATLISLDVTQDNAGFHTGADGIPARNGFVLSDFVIDGNWAGGAGSGDAATMNFGDSTNYSIINVEAKRSRYAGLVISGDADAAVLTDNVTILNFIGSGSYAGALEIAEGKRIKGSHITAIGNNLGAGGHDINIEAGNRSITDVQLENVYVKVTTVVASAKAFSADGDSNNIVDLLVNNFIFDGGVYGVSIKGVGRAKFADGIIKNSTNGFSVSSTLTSSSNISLVNTDITNFGTRGVWLGSNSTAADNVWLSGLDINGGGSAWWGVIVGSGTSGNLTNAWLVDSRIHNTTASNITDNSAVLNQRNVVLSSYPWDNYGTVTIPNGATQAQVTHGMQYTPVSGMVMVSPSSALGAAAYVYSGNYTSTQFTVYSDANPGMDVTVAWHATRPAAGGK